MKIYLADDTRRWTECSQRSFYVMCGGRGIGLIYHHELQRGKWWRLPYRLEVFRLEYKIPIGYAVLRSGSGAVSELRPSPPPTNDPIYLTPEIIRQSKRQYATGLLMGTSLSRDEIKRAFGR